MDIVLRDGTRVTATVAGADDPAVTIVLAHGWTLDHRLWHEVVPQLVTGSAIPVRVIAIDCRGHGTSDKAPTGTATVEQYADDIAEIADRYSAGAKSVVLVGHSMGGVAMSTLAHRHREFFTQTVGGAAFVASSCLPLPKPLNFLARHAPTILPPVLRLGSVGPRWQARLIARGVFGRDPERAEVDLVAQQALDGDRHDLAAFANSMCDKDFTDRVGPYSMIPTLVLGGSRDRLLPNGLQRALVDAIDNARLTIYPEAGHQLPQERPTEVSTALIDLISEVAAARPGQQQTA